MKISKDRIGNWGITFAGTRYSIVRAAADERRWGSPIKLETSEIRTITRTIAGWHFRKVTQTDRIGERAQDLQELMP